MDSKVILNNIILNTLFVLGTLVHTQAQQVPDSLLDMEYKALYDQFYFFGDYNPKSEIYAQAYLKKAKNDGDTLKMITGYHLLADFSYKDYDQSIDYINNALKLIGGNKIKNYPAALYGKRGYIERYHGNFDAALDSYLKELELLDPVQQRNFVHWTNVNIATLKRHLGQYEEAKKLIKENIQYDLDYLIPQHKDSIDYLADISELVSVYRLNNQLDSARMLNDKYLTSGLNNEVGALFIMNRGIFLYYDHQYEQAVTDLESSLAEMIKPENEFLFETYNLVDIYSYLGRSYAHLSDQPNRLFYYKKLDSLAGEVGYIIPETKSVYAELIDHYKETGDQAQQLFYIDKLLQADSILDKRYRYMSHRLSEEYDMAGLMKQKEALIASLKNENQATSYIAVVIFSFLILSLLGLFYFYTRQKIYKRRFKVLLEKGNSSDAPKRTVKDKKLPIADLSEDRITAILKALDKFEDKKGYLKPSLTSQKLAKSLGTNSKYLSIVVNTYKEKSVSQYINDLRIEEAIQGLKSDETFRKYTVQAIGNEFGFNTAEAFSKAFRKKAGIFPSYFIKELEKQPGN